MFAIMVPLGVGFLIGYLFIIKPSLSRLETAKTELSNLQQKITTYQFVLESEGKIAEFKTRFKGDKTWLIEQLNSMAEKSGLNISTILPEDPKKVGEMLELTSVHIDAEAGYHQLGEFMGLVESLDAYVKILDVNIEPELGNTPPARSGASVASGVPAGRKNASSGTYQITLRVGVFTPAQGVI